MATEAILRRESFIAGEDLSSYQYYAVYISADKKVKLCDGTTKKPCGILDNKPNENEAASVVVHGRTPAILGATVSAGAYLMVNSLGKLITGVKGWGAIASAEEGGSADEIVSVFVHRGSFSPPLSP